MQIIARVRRQGPSFTDLGKQAIFATAVAQNRTITDIQQAERNLVRSRFVVRNEPFIMNAVKIRSEDWSRKERLRARVRVEGPRGAEGRGNVLYKHEEGGTRTLRGGSLTGNSQLTGGGSGYFFIPTEVIRHPRTALIPRNMFPSALRLAEFRDVDANSGRWRRKGWHHNKVTAKGIVRLKGKRRTFVLMKPGTNIPIGIFMRGDGSKGRTHTNDIHLIWAYRSRITLKRRLGFEETSERVYRSVYGPHFRRAYEMALRTAYQSPARR